MPITHEWNGTVLTITSDSGTSSADLKGDDGARGAQGVAGVSTIVDMDKYATKEDVNDAISAIPKPDMTEYATTAFVNDELNYIIQNADRIINMSEYARTVWVEGEISNVMSRLLTNYYTRTSVDTKIAEAQADLSNYALKSEIPNLTDFATTDYIAETCAPKTHTHTEYLEASKIIFSANEPTANAGAIWLKPVGDA